MAQDFQFYHIYPLGAFGAPQRNDGHSGEERLLQLLGWVDHLKYLGVNAVYLGPHFESSTHGYDTKDYYAIDKRLGSNETLKKVCKHLKHQGIRIVFDAVFNHTGREFWAFKDLLQNKKDSKYAGWYAGVNFDKPNQQGDPFSYQSWQGYLSLPKLDLKNGDVKDHLLGAVKFWIEEFDIDGLRLDAADCIDLDFHRLLRQLADNKKPGFWLLGEIVMGDYNRWTAPGLLHSVTNYECYKGLWSSHNDRNLYEIAHSFNRQFSDGGIYAHIKAIYNFAENHDVERMASTLKDMRHLDTLYCLLYMMPGVPSIYYGGEFGIEGKKGHGGSDDSPLRPPFSPADGPHRGRRPHLPQLIHNLAAVRSSCPAVRYGDYRQLNISNTHLAFARTVSTQQVLVAVNIADQPATVSIQPPRHASRLTDVMSGDILSSPFQLTIPAFTFRILRDTDGGTVEGIELVQHVAPDTTTAAGLDIPVMPSQPQVQHVAAAQARAGGGGGVGLTTKESMLSEVYSRCEALATDELHALLTILRRMRTS